MLQFQPLESELDRFADNSFPIPMKDRRYPSMTLDDSSRADEPAFTGGRWAVAGRSSGPAARGGRRTCVAPTPPPNATGCCSTGRSKRLRRTGVLGLRVPTGYGGPGGSVRDVLDRGGPDRARQFQRGPGPSRPLRVLRTTAEQPGHRSRTAALVPASSNAGVVVGNADHRREGQDAVEHRTPRCWPTPRGVLRLNGLQVLLDRHAVRRSHRRVGASTPRARTSRRSCPPTATASNCSTTGTVSGSGPPPAGAPASPTSSSTPSR